MSQPWETPCQSSHANTLAVLLTHISHSYISLVQIVAKNDTLHAPPEPALLPASPSYHMPSCSSQPAHMRTAENQSEPASESANHQHVSSKDQGYPGVSHTADVAIPVELCPFQQELAERIMQAKNTVMFLPAGTGQAAVAASVTQQMLMVQPQKHVVYLTDRVHLLYQQAAVFSSQLGIPVSRYCTEESWRAFPSEFHNRRVLFFPASLYLGLLQQGVADVGMVSLLILDEVHQVTKEHPYSTLLRDFHWKLPSDCAPKLLGLLGSPGKGKNGNFERVRKGVNEICWALRAELVTPQIHLDDLEGRLHQAQVEVQSVEAGRHEGNLLYLLHVYCDSLSRLLEKHGFQSFGKLVPAANSASYISFMADAHWAASARMPSDLLLSEAVQVAQEACSLKHHPQAAEWVLVLEHLRQCCQAYRAGQELEPSAALLPIKDALASLQSSLQSRPSTAPLGPVTEDLLQHLSQSALFQELCNGDLQAVPGLMTSGSRLTCLMQLLQHEASGTAAGAIAHSATECEAASGGNGEPTEHATDTEDCNINSRDNVPNSSQAWSGGSRDGKSRQSGHATVEPRGERQIESGAGSSDQAGKGKQAARRVLLFVAEGMTATRLLDVINSMECLNGEPWRPAVLPPGTPTAQHSVLQAFREGTCNLLIAQAGVPCSLDGILCDTIIRFDCLNTVMALSHSRDACLAAGGKFVVLFDSGKQQNELEQLRKEERLVKAVCQMIMHGDLEFEKGLLHLNGGDHDQGADDRALAVLNMFCLDCTGQSLKMSVTASDTPGMQTAAVTLPEGCHISEALQGLERSTAAAAEAAAAMLCLQKLQGQGLLAGYWSSAALLQQAGVEGPWEGGDPGSDAVLWRCEVCGVPATSARNLEDHYKGYKHHRMVARQASAARTPGYHAGNMHRGAARRMPFTPHQELQPSGLGYGSPGRTPYAYPHPHAADRWQAGGRQGTGGALLGSPTQAYDIYPRPPPPSPMTPVMHAHHRQQQHQQQQQQMSHGTSPYHVQSNQFSSPGPWGSHSPYPHTPPTYNHMSPQHPAPTPSTCAASPGSNQPYTCYVCNATATSRKNYMAHLQGRAHVRQVQRTGSQVSRWQDGAAGGDAPPTPSTLAGSNLGTPGSSPYHCPMCGVWVSSQPLLEAHFKGRRHLKRALEQADADAANMGLQPGTTPDTAAVPRTPTVTQYYCEVCGVFATSKEQLVMHNEGKKHKRTVALKELTEGHLPTGSPDADAQAPQTGGAATVETGAQAGAQAGEGEGAGAVDNSLRCLLCRITAPSLEHLQYHLAGLRHRAQVAAQQQQDKASSVAMQSTDSTPTRASPVQEAGSSSSDSAARCLPSPLAQLARQDHPQSADVDDARSHAAQLAATSEGGSPDSAAHKDVVRGLTFDTDDINSSQVCHSVHASEAAGSCAASASTQRFRRSVSFSAYPQVHELRESSQDGKEEEGQSSEGHVPFDQSNLPDGITAIAVPDPSDPSIIVMQFFCPACGIATTSEANLQDHLSGRKHARRVQHLAKASTMPPVPASALASSGEGLLSRKSSGSVYDNFPCVRVGDYDLPSSMDLRQYLDEMQEVGQWEDDIDLPTIPDDEVALHPIDTEAGPSLGRLNSMHRRRKSGSGFGAVVDGSRADAEAAGAAAAAEGSAPSSRSLMHKYKGSMDARSFQQHAARVAELTDTLLAERAADKAACANAKADSTSRELDSEAAVSSKSATPSTASPSGGLSTSPGAPHEPAVPAAPAGGAQTLFPPETAGNRIDSEAALASAEGDELCPPALPRDCAAAGAAASPASASVGGKATVFLPSGTSFPPSGAGVPPNGSADAGVLRGPHYCTVCNVSTTSAVHLQTHYMGSKHQRRLAQSRDRRQHSPHYCPICAISATSAVHLQLHLNGRAHQRKAKLGQMESACYTAGAEESRVGLNSQDNSRHSSAQSSSVSGRQQADRQASGATEAQNSDMDGHLQDTNSRSGAYMSAGPADTASGAAHSSYHSQQHWPGPNLSPARASPDYGRYNTQPGYPQQQYLAGGHQQGVMGTPLGPQGMMGTPLGPQGMMGTAPGPQGMMGTPPGPQGMMATSHAAQPGPLSSPPRGHPGSMPQGMMPLSGPPPMHYMGYYPAPYYPAQSTGPVALPGFMPQPWWSPPGPQIHRPNGLQMAAGQPAAMMHTQLGRPYPQPHPPPRGYRGM